MKLNLILMDKPSTRYQYHSLDPLADDNVIIIVVNFVCCCF